MPAPLHHAGSQALQLLLDRLGLGLAGGRHSGVQGDTHQTPPVAVTRSPSAPGADRPDPTAARTFAFEEPGYQAGAYRDVLLRRWRNALGRTMWDFEGGKPEHNRYLVLGFMLEPAGDAPAPPLGDELIASGPLLSDDGSLVLGAAVLLEAHHADAAGRVLSPERYVGVEVHQWRFGGRPA